MTDSWLEKFGDFVVGLRSPARAAVRKHWRRIERDEDYRLAYELALRVRGYKSAAQSKNSVPWGNASNRSADAEILPDLRTLRNRARALNRDDALASGIRGTLVRGVVGTGLRPQATTGEDEKDEALEKTWWARADKLALADGDMPHGQAQQLRYGKRVEDGEYFLHPAIAEEGEPLWIETVESDRVCTPADAEPLDPRGRIVDGVEKDEHGRIVAYWILKKHPGDVVLGGPLTKLGPKADSAVSRYSKAFFVRVEKPYVRHDRSRVTRPGQTRGVPVCHAILQDLRDLDLLMVASLKRTQIAACFAVFLTSEVNASDLIELTAADYGYQLEQRIEPGMIFRLFPGEKAEFSNPSAQLPDLDKFVFLLARRIGAAVGISPQTVLRAWETLSYSAARTVKIDDRQTYHGERSDFDATLSWEWRIVMEDELLRGNPDLLDAGVTVDDLDAVVWIGDEEQWVDPVAEAQATQIMLDLGLTTYQAECARLGRDWKANLRQIVAKKKLEQELHAEAGVEMTAANTAPAGAPAKVAAPVDDEGLKVVPGKEAA